MGINESDIEDHVIEARKSDDGMPSYEEVVNHGRKVSDALDVREQEYLNGSVDCFVREFYEYQGKTYALNFVFDKEEFLSLKESDQLDWDDAFCSIELVDD